MKEVDPICSVVIVTYIFFVSFHIFEFKFVSCSYVYHSFMIGSSSPTRGTSTGGESTSTSGNLDLKIY